MLHYFFFSSRRRHTRCLSDWSSDVCSSDLTVRVRVKGSMEHTAASGNGPVNALDHALRKALEEFYPNLKSMQLLDYKVRILDESKGTAAKTRSEERRVGKEYRTRSSPNHQN